MWYQSDSGPELGLAWAWDRVWAWPTHRTWRELALIDYHFESQASVLPSKRQFEAPDVHLELQTAISSSRRPFGSSDGHLKLQTATWSSRRSFGAPDGHFGLPDGDLELQTVIWNLTSNENPATESPTPRSKSSLLMRILQREAHIHVQATHFS